MFTSTGVEFNARGETEFNVQQMDNTRTTVRTTKHETEMNKHVHGQQKSTSFSRISDTEWAE
jgi:hypothetical protein